MVVPTPPDNPGQVHGGGDWFFHSNTPHFFKTILPRDLLNLNLRIPVKFVKNHGGSALSSDLVFLEVPSGSLWKVKLHRDDHGVLLQDGCAAFLNHYNIRPGHFLVFRHDTGSRFRVVIFDETACEITYRIGPDQDRGKLLRGTVREKILVDRPPDRKKRKLDPSRPECPSNAKASRNKRRDASLVDNVQGASGRARGPTAGLPSQASAKASDGTNAGGGEAEGHLNSNSTNFSIGAEVAQRSGALSRATSLRCEGPSFFVIVQPSLVHPYFQLRLPKKFSNRFSSKLGVSGEMRLRVSRNRIWTVSYVNHSHCCIRNPDWKEFVVDNDLVVGDVCVFELLTGQIGITFHVTIFHSQEGEGLLSSSNSM